MSTKAASQSSESEAVEAMAEKLRRRFPNASPDRVEEAVAQAHREFDGLPIRQFVPILVERKVVDRLRAGAARSEPART